MLLKSLVLALLLGAFSVSALPNPEAEDFDLEARDDAEELAARDNKNSKCGFNSGAYYKDGRCQCKHDWQEYNKNNMKCEKKCGDDAYYRHGKCHCKNGRKKYNEWKKECYCPEGSRCGGH